MSKKQTKKSKPAASSKKAGTNSRQPAAKTEHSKKKTSMKKIPTHCQVCGYADLAKTPRSSTGGASIDTCACCGFQFGVTDGDKGLSYDDHRMKWIRDGMPWRSSGKKSPKDWQPQTQLGNLALKVTLSRVKGRPPRVLLDY